MTKDIIKLMNGDGRWYIKAAGLSTDPKPVDGISPDSYFYEADTGDEYQLSGGAAPEWVKINDD